jgi:peroxiredoxin
VDTALLIARLVLAGVFVIAAVAKLLDRAGSREALAGFGLPLRLTTPLGWALPIAELIVAAALVPPVSAWWGGLGGLGLLVLFTAAIVRSLVRGERPDCRCFGQFHAVPIGWPTLLRNGLLALLAAFVLGAGWSDPGPSAIGWLAGLPPHERPAVIVGLLAVILLAAVIGILVGGVLAKQTQLLTRLEAIEARLDETEGRPVERPEAGPPDRGLPVGAPAPAFTLPDLGGERRSLASLLGHGRAILLLFVASDCQPCAALVPKVVGWHREHGDTVTMVLVSSGSAEDNRAKFGGLGDAPVLLQVGSEVADVYAPGWTPAAVLIAPTGRVASFASYGDQAIGALVTHAAAAPTKPFLPAPNGRTGRGSLSVVGNGRPGLGQPAPAVALPDLQGRIVDLRDYRGRDTVVVFWNPSCQHCQQLADDLRRWEAEPPRGAPRLFVVSSGSIEANRAFGFRSAMALDETFKVAEAFGVDGTPSAILVDSDGRIASTVGTGARDVLALAGVLSAVDSPPTGLEET